MKFFIWGFLTFSSFFLVFSYFTLLRQEFWKENFHLSWLSQWSELGMFGRYLIGLKQNGREDGKPERIRLLPRKRKNRCRKLALSSKKKQRSQKNLVKIVKSQFSIEILSKIYKFSFKISKYFFIFRQRAQSFAGSFLFSLIVKLFVKSWWTWILPQMTVDFLRNLQEFSSSFHEFLLHLRKFSWSFW